MSSPGGSGGGGGGGYNSSSTTTQVQTQQGTPTLHLVLQPRPQHNVTWAEDTVDNEHLNKKKSKKCCIFSKPRAFGESSSESEGSDDDGKARPTQKKGSRKFCPYGPGSNGKPSSGSNDGGGDGLAA
ncbi:E3 ubiquitin-protein ligase PPP1R11 (Protein phosphatase 1 regulatory subunit 11) [Durusdinium trenchii]|uniref:E3 ubiquitin-protein ligase PPP1R11 (Protein phosphatase 1 regulatory subunit 11) n=1 Tax=Durusdinium trenchii TaxID=1381693 RepID=A0ABP0RLM4_9DINO